MDAAPLGSDSSGFKPHPASCDLASHYPLCPISPTLVSWLPWRGGWGAQGGSLLQAPSLPQGSLRECRLQGVSPNICSAPGTARGTSGWGGAVSMDQPCSSVAPSTDVH